MYTEEELIRQCLNNDVKAQEYLYRRFAPKMFGVCLRFARNQMEAEDLLQEGFIKIFINLNSFRGEGSLEGWIRRTMVNSAINYYKKNIKYQKEIAIDQNEFNLPQISEPIHELSAQELLKLISGLPPGYRMVFNLNIIEGYTHKEIGKLLNISENTSKSQLSRARNTLQKLLSSLQGGNEKHE
jgi:RNA polymerase sigma factor (sigma-70 family)